MKYLLVITMFLIAGCVGGGNEISINTPDATVPENTDSSGDTPEEDETDSETETTDDGPSDGPTGNTSIPLGEWGTAWNTFDPSDTSFLPSANKQEINANFRATYEGAIEGVINPGYDGLSDPTIKLDVNVDIDDNSFEMSGGVYFNNEDNPYSSYNIDLMSDGSFTSFQENDKTGLYGQLYDDGGTYEARGRVKSTYIVGSYIAN